MKGERWDREEVIEMGRELGFGGEEVRGKKEEKKTKKKF